MRASGYNKIGLQRKELSAPALSTEPGYSFSKSLTFDFILFVVKGDKTKVKTGKDNLAPEMSNVIERMIHHKTIIGSRPPESLCFQYKKDIMFKRCLKEQEQTQETTFF